MKATKGDNICFCFNKEDIGERIFLTKAEAEAAQKKQEENR